MKKSLKVLLWSFVVLALFTGAFAGFARMRAGSWDAVPLVARMVQDKPDPAQEPAEPESVSVEPPPPAPRAAALGVLDVFRIDSPLSAAELDSLASELKSKRAELDQRLVSVATRERQCEERAHLLEEQNKILQDLRTGLETWQLELDQRQAEIQRDEDARAEREAVGWAALAKLFEKGDAVELAPRLQAYEPDEAARLLHHLKPTRAQELLGNIAQERWKEYADAYRRGSGK